MPKLTEHARLSQLEARQRKVTQEVEDARAALRERYADVVREIAIETIPERTFRDLLAEILRVGGDGALSALKATATPIVARTTPSRATAKGGPAAAGSA